MQKKRELLLTMKLTFFFLVVGLLQVHASLRAQEKKVDLDVKEVTLRNVFKELQKQTNLDFFFSNRELDLNTKVTFQAQKTDLLDVLTSILGKGYSVEMVEEMVVIKPAIARDTIERKTLTLRGKVSDAKNNPLPGVTVVIKGTGMGVVTDAEGNYAIQLPETKDIRLIFSFIGMETQEVSYAGQKEVNVTLQEKAEQMAEVVVTGYQIVDRRKNTSAIQSIDMDDIMTSATSIDQMLEGRVTDMMLMTNSGEVGVAPKIRIRGTSTLVGNREPIWVVDGIILQDPVPVSAEELNDPDYVNRIGNAIAGLNPQDIERLDILKDAAATALYGTKAANGVIVITTKKGHAGAPIINYNMTTTFRQRPRYSDRKIDLMNSKERIQFSRELCQEHYKFGDVNGTINWVGYEGLLRDLYAGRIDDDQFAVEVAKLETVNTDWFDLLTEDSWSHQHTLSMSGGSDKARYYASIGYARDNDVIRGNHTQRYTASLNLESTLTKWLTASFQMLGNVSKKEYSQDNLSPIDYAYNTSRAIPAYGEDGEYSYFEKKSGNSFYAYNILNELDNSYKKQNSSGLTVTTNLKFNFTDWLNANAIVSYNTSNANIEGYWGEKTFYVTELRGTEYGNLPSYSSTLPFGGELSYNETRNQSYTVRLQLNANKYFGMDEQHNINASAGYEMSSVRYNGMSTIERGYYADRGKAFVNNLSADDYPSYAAWLATNVPTITDNLTNTMSGYATLSYSYQNYFTLNINGRVDGSNKFGSRSNDKFLPIWSVSGAYNFSEHEALYTDWIDLMSLKVSYGFQGNMLDESPVMTIRKLPINTYFGEMESEMKQYPNPNLKWEKTASFNTGVNFSLFKNRIQLQAEYYYKRTKDAFMSKDVATMNGVDSYTINGGDVENQGYSIDLTVLPVKTKDWIWTLSTSFSKNYNKVKNDPSSQTYDYNSFLTGTAVVRNKAVNTFYSYKFLGLSPVDGGPLFDDMEVNRHELMGLNKYDTYTRVLVASGRREPSMSGGLSTNLRYKNLRMSAMFTYSLGAKTRLFRMFNKDLGPENNVHRDFMKRWRRPGDEVNTNIPALIAYGTTAYWNYYQHYSNVDDDIQQVANDAWEMYDYSDARVVSANYLKCSSLSFTYEFGERILPKIGLQRLALSLSGTNLFTICSKKLKGQTPTQGGFSEIQLSDRPTYSFGLSVSF